MKAYKIAELYYEKNRLQEDLAHKVYPKDDTPTERDKDQMKLDEINRELEKRGLEKNSGLHPDYRHCDVCAELVHTENEKETGHEPDNCEGKR